MLELLMIFHLVIETATINGSNSGNVGIFWILN